MGSEQRMASTFFAEFKLAVIKDPLLGYYDAWDYYGTYGTRCQTSETSIDWKRLRSSDLKDISDDNLELSIKDRLESIALKCAAFAAIAFYTWVTTWPVPEWLPDTGWQWLWWYVWGVLYSIPAAIASYAGVYYAVLWRYHLFRPSDCQQRVAWLRREFRSGQQFVRLCVAVLPIMPIMAVIGSADILVYNTIFRGLPIVVIGAIVSIIGQLWWMENVCFQVLWTKPISWYCLF